MTVNNGSWWLTMVNNGQWWSKIYVGVFSSSSEVKKTLPRGATLDTSCSWRSPGNPRQRNGGFVRWENPSNHFFHCHVGLPVLVMEMLIMYIQNVGLPWITWLDIIYGIYGSHTWLLDGLPDCSIPDVNQLCQFYTNVMRAKFTRTKGHLLCTHFWSSRAAHQPSASPAAQGLGDCLGVLSRSISWKCWMYFASADSRPCPEETGSRLSGFHQPPVRPPKMRAIGNTC